MSDFFDRIKKLFAQAANEQQPATHEIFTRTAAEVEVYQQWKRSKRLPRILESFQARLEGRMSSEAELMLHFIDTPKSRGFVLLHEDGIITGNEMRHLMDYFQEQLLTIGYVSYMSDVRNQLHNNDVITTERHYLKPKFNFDEGTGTNSQRFGNIAIEYIQKNNEPVELKLISNIYSDRKYADARPFEELMEILVLK
jgi:hypothetical protein